MLDFFILMVGVRFPLKGVLLFFIHFFVFIIIEICHIDRTGRMLFSLEEGGGHLSSTEVKTENLLQVISQVRNRECISYLECGYVVRRKHYCFRYSAKVI